MDTVIDKLLEYSGLNAKQFASKIGLSRPQAIYDIQKGKTKSISRAMANKILSVFPELNEAWLYTGKGNMRNSVGDNNSGVNIIGSNALTNSPIDNRQYYSDSPDVLKAQIEILDERIKEKDAQIKEKDAQIKEKDAQINKLLSILSQK